MKRELWELKQMQSLPLELKIIKSQQRIREWYDHWEGQVYVSFSGGKDSTVLLHLVRAIYPDVPAVFADTGLEFPEIRDFVKSIENVVWLKPAMHFREVIRKHGYPVISKEQSSFLQEYRTSKSPNLKDIRWNGNKYGRGKIADKWKPLVNAPFDIGDKCCDEMKKKPFAKYGKETGRKAMTGEMAGESDLRQSQWMRYGCNAFDNKKPKSTPLSFWLENDIWRYIKQNNIQYSSVYDMGYARTGCIFCAFGAHLEKRPNRFQKLEKTHPQLHKYCMETLGMREVLEYLDIPHEDRQLQLNFEEDGT